MGSTEQRPFIKCLLKFFRFFVFPGFRKGGKDQFLLGLSNYPENFLTEIKRNKLFVYEMISLYILISKNIQFF